MTDFVCSILKTPSLREAKRRGNPEVKEVMYDKKSGYGNP
jgi:hypothetical protein